MWNFKLNKVIEKENKHTGKQQGEPRQTEKRRRKKSKDGVLYKWRCCSLNKKNTFTVLFSLTARSCGNPGVPNNGKKNSSSYQYGNSIKFECNVGYTLQGSAVRTCEDNGLWTGTQPTCQSKLDIFLVLALRRQQVETFKRSRSCRTTERWS